MSAETRLFLAMGLRGRLKQIEMKKKPKIKN